ncbi:MAG: carbohydrate-binding domain-containing protein [Clostridia bacterium]|nr:carbohydrate-binding domain-containing protein [Clostridia bacterium]
MKKKVLVFVGGVLAGAIIASSGFLIYSNLNNDKMPNGDRPQFMERPDGEEPPDGMPGGGPMQENKEKDTKAEDVDAGETVNSKQINLSEYNSNLTISEAGTYTLSGSFKNSVVVNADGDVTLILNGVNIESTVTAAIANGTTNALTIKLEDNTENNLSDGGSSEYDGCIFSYGKLTIEGNGTLNVNGKQEDGEGIATKSCDIVINSGTINIESQDDGLNAGGSGGSITINGGAIYIKANGDGIDSNGALTINGGNVYTIGSAQGGDAGIDTDEGFVFNGGEVIAIGSDMLEKPENTSKQKSVCFQLTTKVSSGSKVEVKNASGETIASFEAKEDFKTLIVSNSKVTDGTHYIYVNGEKVQ